MTYRISISPKNLEQHLEELDVLRRAFDAISIHVIITDSNANILYANKAAERNTGFSVNEVIGKNPGDLWGGNMPDDFYRTMWHTIKDERKPFVGAVENTRKDGTRYRQELYISPVLDAQDRIKFFIGIEPNIADTKQQDQFRKEFLSILEHQSKEPRTVIRWTLGFLLKQGALTKQQEEKLRNIYSQNQNLIDVLNDLLLISRTGEGRLGKETIDLWEVIHTVAKSVRKEYPHVSFLYEKDVVSPRLSANKRLVEQVFAHIITNAAAYSDTTDPRVVVGLKKIGGLYLFSCENNGQVIVKEDQPHIFSQFFRAENALKAKIRGAGLGLYIVHMITDSFGWRAWFESPAKSGSGAIFYITIPTGS